MLSTPLASLIPNTQTFPQRVLIKTPPPTRENTRYQHLTTTTTTTTTKLKTLKT